jgi:carotenoid cleavage dioxygenase-like enzyme
MITYPDKPNFTGAHTPSRVEADIAYLNIALGEVPFELDGAFFRVQPDPAFPPRLGDDIIFNGDGMISRFRFKNGKVDFKQRWAQTDKLKLEMDAGKALFGAYRNPLTDDPTVKGKIRGTANTNAFIHGKKLYALKEDSPALEMDPSSLATSGFCRFNNKMLGDTFTAHPKIDPATGNMAGFGYASKGILTKDMTYYEVSPDGDLLYDIWFQTPYYCMMHDFAITPDYALFSVTPVTSNWKRLEEGLPHFGFDTTLPSYMAVVPRKAGTTADDIRWFKGDNAWASHVVGGFQEGNKVHLDMPVSPNNFFAFFPDIHTGEFNPKEATPRITRWTADLDSDSETFSVTQLGELVCEFPRIDDRFTSLPYQYSWMLSVDSTKPAEVEGSSAGKFLINTLVMLDVTTKQEKSWWCGPTSSLQEPCFIPRPGGDQEGDGWLVMVINRLNSNSSDLALFDARDIEKGPITLINIPVRMRFGLHGNWVDAKSAGLI